MDKIKKYQNIILNFLHEYATKSQKSNPKDVETRVIADYDSNSFQALYIGWDGKKFEFSPILHFDIRNNKIWLQCNNTEREVVDELMAAGVPPDDIILGFQPPYARQFTGFAVA
ncbi:MAG: XisI protein [Saprospirales bacterium]|nr:XisI protein [Saprospirales bacterium]MBK8923843.1 XisI protein [Saprospirales bacterium]